MWAGIAGRIEELGTRDGTRDVAGAIAATSRDLAALRPVHMTEEIWARTGVPLPAGGTSVPARSETARGGQRAGPGGDGAGQSDGSLSDGSRSSRPRPRPRPGSTAPRSDGEFEATAEAWARFEGPSTDAAARRRRRPSTPCGGSRRAGTPTRGDPGRCRCRDSRQPGGSRCGPARRAGGGARVRAGRPAAAAGGAGGPSDREGPGRDPGRAAQPDPDAAGGGAGVGRGAGLWVLPG